MALDEVFKAAQRILDRYPVKEAALLPTLHLVQRAEGFISDQSIEAVADFLQIPPIRVEKVVTFYTMFRRTPSGRHSIEVCTNLSCSLLGADHLVAYLQKLLGITVGETTPDRLFSLKTVECLGSCGTAPVMQIDDDFYEGLTEEKIAGIIDRFKSEATQ
jgi:NADH-quinone oxidoreductase subunit E